MNDTSPVITKKYRAMIMSKTSTERLKMASRMFDSGKKLVKAGIIAKRGILSEEEMRAAILTRMYQSDFSKVDLQKIISKQTNLKTQFGQR